LALKGGGGKWKGVLTWNNFNTNPTDGFVPLNGEAGVSILLACDGMLLVVGTHVFFLTIVQHALFPFRQTQTACD
jgi:hypothetical protein